MKCQDGQKVGTVTPIFSDITVGGSSNTKQYTSQVV